MLCSWTQLSSSNGLWISRIVSKVSSISSKFTLDQNGLSLNSVLSNRSNLKAFGRSKEFIEKKVGKDYFRLILPRSWIVEKAIFFIESIL